MDCTHHWVLGPPLPHLESDGTCKKCGLSKRFKPMADIEGFGERGEFVINSEKFRKRQRAKKSRAISKASRVGFSL